MGLEPITVTLSTFEKLEILRSELKVREEELQGVERDLRSAMRALAQHRYLKSLSTYYGSQPTPSEAAMVPELDKRRQALFQLVSAIRSEIPKLEAAVSAGGPGTAPQPRTEANRRNRFEA